MNKRQNIILFTEKPENSWDMPSKIGNLFLNSFAIDEDDANEVVGVYDLHHNETENMNIIESGLTRAAEYRLDIELEDIHLAFAKNYLNMSDRAFSMISNKMRMYDLRSTIV